MYSDVMQSDDVTVPLFRPFTQESLSLIEARKAEPKSEGVIGTDPDPTLEDDVPLPRKFARNFPSELIATPIEDLDKHYANEKTFMFINKGKDIFRFSATNSLFILSPFNPLRRYAIYIIVHPAFTYLAMAAIFINFVFMTFPANPTTAQVETIFLIIFTVESFIKVIARGFILEQFTYLRDPWNWLDFLLNALGYISMFIDIGGFIALRTLRGLKAPISGLRTTERAIMKSVKNLKDILILTLFSLSVFALLGVQLFMGVLTQKCVKIPDPNLNMAWNDYVSNYALAQENWLQEDGTYIMCGNSSGARHCPSDSTCVQGIGPNPNYGYTTFDSFPWALLSAFQLMTLDFWESLYHAVLKTEGPWHICFFIVIIFWCSFFLVYLIVAVMYNSYDEIMSKMYAEEKEAIAAEKAVLQGTADAAAAEAEATTNCLDSPGSDKCLSKKQSVVTVINMKDLRVVNDIIEDAAGRQSKASETGRDEEEISLKKQQKKSCLGKCTDIFCVWDCCACWIKFQRILSLIVFDPFTELFITLVVVANILFMAMDHHNMEESLYLFLHNGNYFFTIVYITEAVLKIIALSPKYYFREGWNKFDFFIAVESFIELGLEGIQGLSILTSFRLLRVFKLAKVWPNFNLMLSIMGQTMKWSTLGSLTYILGVIVFTYAVMGMHLFKYNYYDLKHLFSGGEMPYWNFTDFMHSFMIVFRALCGEWIESMWDCMLVGGWTCIPFFLSFVAIAKLVVLNLFFALLLFSSGAVLFRRSNSDLVSSLTPSSKKLKEAAGRIARVCQCLKRFLFKDSKVYQFNNTMSTTQEVDQNSEKVPEEVPKALTPVEAVEDSSKVEDSLNSDKLDADNKEAIILEYPADCCSDCCYVRLPFCKGNESGFWVGWRTFRMKCFYVLEHRYFEILAMIMILISSLALAAEDINLKDRPTLRECLQYMDIVITVFFLFEMLLKWLGYGFTSYFKNTWCRLDFVILMISILNILIGQEDIETLSNLRVLLPLRAVSRVQRMKVVVDVMVSAIPAIINVFFVVFIFWLIFAILGVQLMGGKFFSCVDIDNNKLNISFVQDKYECHLKNFIWTNQQINFDDVLNAYLALFQVATFKGWINIMKNGIDSTTIDQQPLEEAFIYMYLYFVLFIIFGVFFALSLFIGVVIDNFNEQKRRKGGVSLEIFMTEDQKKYYREMKKMNSKKPTKAISRPESKLQALVFDLVTSKKFDMVIMIFICLNMVVVAMEHYDPTPLFDTILESLNEFFIGIFTVECVLKIFALRKNYFKKPWNVYDFVIVILSILGIILTDLIAQYYFVPPIFLKVVSVVKIGRVLRLVKFLLQSKGIQTLWSVLSMSFPDLFNIWLFHFLVIFIYAIYGMFLFMNVHHRAGIDQSFNFETFGQTMILLFQLSTSAGWDNILAATMNEENCNFTEDGDCGSHTTAILYLVSYLVISLLIIIMYIATILEKYNQAKEDMREGLTEEDYDMYYEIWQKFDPDGTQFINYSDLSTFLDSLKEPLRIEKPNKYKIISMDIPIYADDLVNCVDILDALTKDFLQRKGHRIEGTAELAVVPREIEGCRPVSSTMKQQRKSHSARVIQLAWRQHKSN